MSNTNNTTTTKIPVEIISEEEMAFLESALAAAAAGTARSPLPATSSILRSAPLWAPTPPLHFLGRAAASYSTAGDIEDAMVRPTTGSTRPLLEVFRARKALAVTDVTATEWCEKQMEFMLLHGKPVATEAMKAGSNRHAQLEKEVMERVMITIKSAEESWAVKFMNFIVGTNQLLLEGITRELPVIGIIEDVWMVGVIDEIRMPMNDATPKPMLMDTKTRYKPTAPSVAQKRNGTLQLMCYKYLWDSLIAEKFPADKFFSYFDLNPSYILSDIVKEYINTVGFQVKTLEDVLNYFRQTCHLLPRSNEQLLLRYELQADNSLLEEYEFSYDPSWVEDQLQECLSFWLTMREPRFVLQEERWKCQFCKFASICPMTTSS